MPWVTHRGVLALDAGAVEAQGGDAGGAAGDVEDALVVALPRLRLRQVFGRQGDGLHHAHGDVDLGGGQDLRAVLRGKRGAEMKWESCTASPSSGTPPLRQAGPCAARTPREPPRANPRVHPTPNGLLVAAWASTQKRRLERSLAARNWAFWGKMAVTRRALMLALQSVGFRVNTHWVHAVRLPSQTSRSLHSPFSMKGRTRLSPLSLCNTTQRSALRFAAVSNHGQLEAASPQAA